MSLSSNLTNRIPSNLLQGLKSWIIWGFTLQAWVWRLWVFSKSNLEGCKMHKLCAISSMWLTRDPIVWKQPKNSRNRPPGRISHWAIVRSYPTLINWWFPVAIIWMSDIWWGLSLAFSSYSSKSFSKSIVLIGPEYSSPFSPDTTKTSISSGDFATSNRWAFKLRLCS